MELARVTAIAARLCSDRGWDAPRYIDAGNSAAVYEVTRPDGPAALKIYDPTFFEGSNALIEVKRIELQRELKDHGCPNLIEVLDAGELEADGTWFLLMEYSPWQSLERQLTRVPAEAIHNLVKQLIGTVKFLDQRGYVHRDIKPANIVVSDDFQHLKLLDFGVLRRVAHDEGSGTDVYKFIATAQYSPPEFLSRDETVGAEGFSAINVYQVGAVLHDLIMRTPLFGGEAATNNKFILYKAVAEKVPRLVAGEVEPRLIALCAAALDKDPRKRASVTLDDFLVDADDLEAIRRRVGRRGIPSSTVAARPSLTVVQGQVQRLIRKASGLERETLGAVKISLEQIEDGAVWCLDFETAPRAPIFVELRGSLDGFTAHVKAHRDGAAGPSVFRVTANGLNVPESGVPGALAAEYLRAIDQAVAATPSTDPHQGGDHE